MVWLVEYTCSSNLCVFRIHRCPAKNTPPPTLVCVDLPYLYFVNWVCGFVDYIVLP